MASIGMVHSGGKLSFPNFTSGDKSNPNSVMTMFPANPNFPISKNIPNQGLSSSCRASITPANPSTVSPPNYEHATDDDNKNVEKIDSWMRDSVGDIVKNLKQAPLLVQIYGNSENSNGMIRIQTEKAIMEKWPEVKIQWEKEGSKAPDGLIFVDLLEEEDDDDDKDRGFGEGVSRAWGLVVQGKGVECGPACYLLKTNRVVGGMGLGFCTHFCLMRVKNFRDSALDQLRDSWLLQ